MKRLFKLLGLWEGFDVESIFFLISVWYDLI